VTVLSQESGRPDRRPLGLSFDFASVITIFRIEFGIVLSIVFHLITSCLQKFCRLYITFIVEMILDVVLYIKMLVISRTGSNQAKRVIS
jgi:hypothetical protein